MGLPYLHVHAGTPFAYNDWGKQALFVSDGIDGKSQHPTVVYKPDLFAVNNRIDHVFSKLNARQASLALSKVGTYTERVVIPEGYYGTFFASGYEDDKQPFRWVIGRVDGGTPGMVITKLKNQAFRYGWRACGRLRCGLTREGQLSWCGLRIAPYDPDQVVAGVPEYEFRIRLVGEYEGCSWVCASCDG